MKRFCANDMLLSMSTCFFYLPISSFSEVTSPCRSPVYPFLSQVNCSALSFAGIRSRCFAVLCCGCLLTIPELQLRKEKKTYFFRLQHNKASNYSKLLAILIKTGYINWSSTTKDKCINANLMAPVFSQVCLNKEN